MIVCGIEIKGSEAIFSVLRANKRSILDITGNFKKLKLKDDKNCQEVKSFLETIKSHFNSLSPDRIAIIQRNKSGGFAGGAVSFKIEGLIQTYESRNVTLVSPHTLKKFARDKNPTLPPVNKYQNGACLLALYLLDK